MFFQIPVLRLCFHSLSDGRHVQRFCECYGRVEDFFGSLPADSPGKLTIQLQDIKFQFLKRLHRGISGSEIVQQHSESFFMKRPDHLSQLFPVSFGKGFRHLKLYIFRAQLMFLQICSPLPGKIFRI